MAQTIRAVILDWAGTVIDYGCFAPMHAFMKTFEKEGVPITVNEAREPMGLLKRDHIRAILHMNRVKQVWFETFKCDPTEGDVERLYETFEPALMDSLEQFTDPIPGAVEAVSRLRNKGIKIGSTTGYTKRMMEVVAHHAKNKGYSPDYWVSSDEVKKGRPYPYMIFRNLSELEAFPPQSAIKVGDTVADVQEGKNAGVWTVAVIKGSSELGLALEEVERMNAAELEERMNTVRRRFEEAGADSVIESIDRLPELVERLERQL